MSKIITVPLAKLNLNKVQSSLRTTPAALASLRAAIQETEYIKPIEITDNFTIVDGHRRCAVAVSLGLDRIECIVVEGDAKELFGRLNGPMRRQSGVEWFQGWEQSGDAFLRVMPKSVATHIRAMCAVFGRDRAKELARRGESPSYTIRMYSTSSWILERTGETLTPAEIGEWFFAKKTRINKTLALMAPGRKSEALKVLRAVRRGCDL